MPATSRQIKALANMRKGKQPKHKKSARSGFMGIKGHGDYYMKGNKLAVDSVPDFNVGNRETIITHREYIQDMRSSGVAGAFQNQVFAINPGLNNTFPWLSAVAGQYEEYQILGMVFELKSISSDALNSTNTALGSVIMATQYNANASAFTNKIQMENYEFAVSCKPSQSIIHPIECKKDETAFGAILNVRSGAVGANQDRRLYDWGNLNVASVGFQGTTVVYAELWCSYKIRLLKPKIATTLGGTLNDCYSDHFTSNGSGVTTSAYFGSTIPSASSTSSFGCTLTNTTITIPSGFTGNVMIAYALVGSATAYAPITMTGSSGATALNVAQSNSASVWGISATASTQYQMNFFSCVSGGTITLSGGTLVTSPTYLDVYINAIAYNN